MDYYPWETQLYGGPKDGLKVILPGGESDPPQQYVIEQLLEPIEMKLIPPNQEAMPLKTRRGVYTLSTYDQQKRTCRMKW